MIVEEDKFTLESNGVTLKVERLNLPGQTTFRVVFSSPRKPLIISRATNANAVKFWTSIPEGRQQEAEGVGRLIEQYFQFKK